MKRIISISLLLALFISIFPWEGLKLCPNKNGHHAQEEMHHGNCADGMMEGDSSEEPSEAEDKIRGGFAYKSPSCTSITAGVDSYTGSPSFYKVNIQQLAVLTVLLEWLGRPAVSKQELYPAPEFRNKSGPPSVINPLRGPPIV